MFSHFPKTPKDVILILYLKKEKMFLCLVSDRMQSCAITGLVRQKTIEKAKEKVI